MQKKPLSTRLSYILIAVLILGAFAAGSRLRDVELATVADENTSVQANAVLKFTPECPPVQADKAAPSPKEDRGLVSSVVKLLRVYYLEPITPEKETNMSRGMVRGMLGALKDPESYFVDPTERELLNEASAGIYRGIGAVLSIRRETRDKLDFYKVVVVSPMPGSPAEKAGVKAGDVVTHVNGKWIATHNPLDEPDIADAGRKVRNKEMTEGQYRKLFESALERARNGTGIADALETLTSKTSGEAGFTIERPGISKPMEFKKVGLAKTVVKPVTSRMLSKNALYVKIAQFNSATPQNFASVLDKAWKSARKPSGLVLDLRNNPGGFTEAAGSVVSRVAGAGIFGVIQQKDGRKELKAAGGRQLPVRVVALVNGGTSSVAELVAGALKERKNAILVGEKTFGDGMAQTPLNLRDGSMAVITTGKMLTPRGVDFEGRGISPDRTVKPSASGDTQLSEASRIASAKQ